jgi:hypothetical protein
MSVLSWLFPGKVAKRRVLMPDSSGMSRTEATRPVASAKNTPVGAAAATGGHAANRKNERMARREMLYNVVRESMVRAGVLSASYKFKVLSLDARGRQFLVMMDLAREFGGQTEGLSEIEALIAQSAKSRYDIVVSAVYWRINDHVAVGNTPQLRAVTAAPAPVESQPGLLESQPGALEPHAAMPAPVARPIAAAVAARTATQESSSEAVTEPAPLQAVPAPPNRFQPIQADEVAAFKRALAAGVPTPARATAAAVAATAAAAAVGVASAKVTGPRNITLLTGYEETEMPDPDVPMPALSATQYGDLM